MALTSSQQRFIAYLKMNDESCAQADSKEGKTKNMSEFSLNIKKFINKYFRKNNF